MKFILHFISLTVAFLFSDRGSIGERPDDIRERTDLPASKDPLIEFENDLRAVAGSLENVLDKAIKAGHLNPHFMHKVKAYIKHTDAIMLKYDLAASQKGIDSLYAIPQPEAPMGMVQVKQPHNPGKQRNPEFRGN